ncbi:MAG: DUF2442 domain-containing protein [Bacteroidales bacterium]|jgi:Mn-dependent DtxR family transcriptional regulator|nr:DUF2442 domain-containing protein [Bacteroidales bacterium]
MEIKISKLWFEGNKIFILTEKGETLWQSLLWYSRLLDATKEQRKNYRTTFSGIHWPDIDEDMSYESFYYNNLEPEGISRLFITHPELNVSAVARRLGIQQSLLAAYIRGTKKPSIDRENEIKVVIRQIGNELAKL